MICDIQGTYCSLLSAAYRFILGLYAKKKKKTQTRETAFSSISKAENTGLCE